MACASSWACVVFLFALVLPEWGHAFCRLHALVLPPADVLYLGERLSFHSPSCPVAVSVVTTADTDVLRLGVQSHPEAFRVNDTHVVAASALALWYGLGAWLRHERTNQTVVPAVAIRGQMIRYVDGSFESVLGSLAVSVHCQ
jgi:hypothetical protein